MNFQTLQSNLSPVLRAIARRHAGRSPRFDEDDFYQEMCLYLWNNYKNGIPEGINESYIIKGCEFHILNYIRKEKEKRETVSLEEPVGEDKETLKEILPSQSEPLLSIANRNVMISDVMKGDLTEREKQVFPLLLQGYTTREIGDMLGISHVMVTKFKQNLISKWQKGIKGQFPY